MKYYLLVATCLCLSANAALAKTQITLSNGDKLQGIVVNQDEEIVTFQHETLGVLSLARSQISHLTNEIEDHLSESTAQTKAAQNALLSTWLLPNWEKHLDVGVSGADGNSRSQDIHTALIIKTESSKRRHEIQAAYDSSEKDGDKSRDEFFTHLNSDWLIPNSQYFYFASSRFDWDDFQDWDYRLNIAGGGGYDFINNDTRTLRGKAGLGLNRESGGGDDDISPEGLLELASTWQLTKNHGIELKTTFYPQLEELQEFRNITTLAWVNKLNGFMRLKVGLSNEHDTDVPDDIKKNDFKYSTSLSWDL